MKEKTRLDLAKLRSTAAAIESMASRGDLTPEMQARIDRAVADLAILEIRLKLATRGRSLDDLIRTGEISPELAARIKRSLAKRRGSRGEEVRTTGRGGDYAK